MAGPGAAAVTAVDDADARLLLEKLEGLKRSNLQASLLVTIMAIVSTTSALVSFYFAVSSMK
jgi:hypothetical protein